MFDCDMHVIVLHITWVNVYGLWNHDNKKIMNILKKNIMDYAIATVFYMAIRYATAIGRGARRCVGYLNLF